MKPVDVNNQSEKAQQTRARLLEHAADAFADLGFNGTSLNEIIRQSGMTKGAFYFHFASKEDLAFAIFRTKQKELIDKIKQLAPPEGTARDQFQQLLRVRARLLTDDKTFRGYLKLASELVVMYGPGSDFANSYSAAPNMFAELIKRGQDDGSFSTQIDPKSASEFVFSALLGADEISKAVSATRDLPERTERLIDFLLAGLTGH